MCISLAEKQISLSFPDDGERILSLWLSTQAMASAIEPYPSSFLQGMGWPDFYFWLQLLGWLWTVVKCLEFLSAHLHLSHLELGSHT